MRKLSAAQRRVLDWADAAARELTGGLPPRRIGGGSCSLSGKNVDVMTYVSHLSQEQVAEIIRKHALTTRSQHGS